VKGTTQES